MASYISGATKHRLTGDVYTQAGVSVRNAMQSPSASSRIFWPVPCPGSDLSGFLIGWNVQSFTACVAGVIPYGVGTLRDIEGALGECFQCCSATAAVVNTLPSCRAAATKSTNCCNFFVLWKSCNCTRRVAVWHRFAGHVISPVPHGAGTLGGNAPRRWGRNRQPQPQQCRFIASRLGIGEAAISRTPIQQRQRQWQWQRQRQWQHRARCPHRSARLPGSHRRTGCLPTATARSTVAAYSPRHHGTPPPHPAQ